MTSVTDKDNHPRILVTVATYNERENLPLLLDEIQQYAPDADVLVIDDNSPDGTGQWCEEQAKATPQLHCLHREGKLGLGTAIVAGMQYALSHGYDYVLNMDADFSHHPRYLPDLIAGMNPAESQARDVMIGSRYIDGGKIEGWGFKRHFMSKAINFYSRWLLWLSPKDCSGSFRCYRTELLKKVDLTKIRSRGYSFQEEILWLCRRADARMAETPITFADRERGVSKIDNGEALSALWIIFSLGLRNLLPG
ncbi:MAG: polyprenol monophosphomannose synthase [Pirellulales bacterium]|nr:polyprenol monophosphomannose synthase [Pirellulales bacterium]